MIIKTIMLILTFALGFYGGRLFGLFEDDREIKRILKEIQEENRKKHEEGED